jgi:peptidoglycan/xylan/chitin deacetylase (PgdA/CDA1 family)
MIGQWQRTLTALLILALHPLAYAADPPSVALYYGKNAPLDELHAFDIVVVEPGHGYDPNSYRTRASELFAYVSVGEVHPSRPYFKDLPEGWKLVPNTAWGSMVVDQAQPEWPRFMAERIVAPLWQAGYRGLFLDTLDSYRLAGNKVDEKAQQEGLVRVIRELRSRFPGIRLIANRGFEILPSVKQDLIAVAAESLYQRWDAAAKRYGEVPEADRAWLMEQLKAVRDTHALQVIVIDYVAPADRALTRATAQRIRSLGFTPWVSDGALESLGVGALEVMPRRVLLLYDGREQPSLNFTNAHRYIAMPLNHLGYVPEYVDVQKFLPEEVLPGRYAGIVTWFTGGLDGGRANAVLTWLRKQIETSVPVAVLGQLGFGIDGSAARVLDLATSVPSPTGKLSIAEHDAMIGFETAPQPDRRALTPLRLSNAAGNKSLLQVRDVRGQSYDAAAITRWGGFVLDPCVVFDLPGSEQVRWVIDPFAFLTQALRLPAMPVPDATTENGRRLLIVHIDGDGFPSRAEFPGTPYAAEVLLREVLEKYRVPTTMSVIEAEVGEAGIYKALSPQLEDIARRMFALPHVEIASHTYSHPFNWAKAEARASPDDPNAYYGLRVPGYSIDIEREIRGSVDYIRRKLAPRGKPVRILLWSGDASPGEPSLRMAYDAGLLNMNGGNTSITRSNPSLTGVYPLGIEKAGLFQTYAPIINENVYTNLWRGPFYGYERVIETFELTDKPRRLKPINIYYHTYSATKPAGLGALQKVYTYALSQPIHPVHVSEFIRMTHDFNRMVVARDGDTWVVRGAGELRTLRAPPSLGAPVVSASRNVAGHAPGAEGRYIHLASDDSRLRFAESPATSPYLASANARLTAWRTDGDELRFALKGHMPLEITLGNAERCRVSANERPLKPRRQERGLSEYRLPDAAGSFRVSCRNG